jgi:hypothetical protein
MNASKHSQNGFSIAGAMVGLAITGIAFAALAQYLSTAQSATGGMQNKIDFQILKGSIEQALSNSAMCENAFKGSTFKPGRGIVFGKVDQSPNQMIAVRGTEGGEGLYVGTSLAAYVGQDLGAGLSITTLELKAIGDEVVPNLFPVELRVEASKKPGSGMGPQKLNNFKNPFRFAVLLNDDDQIIGCTSNINPVQTTVINPPAAPQAPSGGPVQVSSITCTKNFSYDWFTRVHYFFDGQPTTQPAPGALMFENDGAAGNYFFQFTPEDCGGSLPPVESVGAISNNYVCGGGGPEVVLNPGQGLDPRIRLAAGFSAGSRYLISGNYMRGPGVYFYMPWASPAVCNARAFNGSAGMISVVYTFATNGSGVTGSGGTGPVAAADPRVIECYANPQATQVLIPASGIVAYRFAAQDCGGRLPDSRYVGALKQVSAHGGGNMSFVANAGETVSLAGLATFTGPGAAFNARGSHADGTIAVFNVVYVLR